MGFESKVWGFISVASGKSIDERIKEIEKSIESLPSLKDDIFPFLPKEIFGVSKLVEGENNVPIAYRSIMIHFGLSMKQLDEEIGVWLNKYEQFLKRIPNALESIVNIQMTPYTGNYQMSHLRYHWYKEVIPKSEGNSFWRLEGDPTNWDGLVKTKFMPSKWELNPER